MGFVYYSISKGGTVNSDQVPYAPPGNGATTPNPYTTQTKDQIEADRIAKDKADADAAQRTKDVTSWTNRVGAGESPLDKAPLDLQGDVQTALDAQGKIPLSAEDIKWKKVNDGIIKAANDALTQLEPYLSGKVKGRDAEELISTVAASYNSNLFRIAGSQFPGAEQAILQGKMMTTEGEFKPTLAFNILNMLNPGGYRQPQPSGKVLKPEEQIQKLRTLTGIAAEPTKEGAGQGSDNSLVDFVSRALPEDAKNVLNGILNLPKNTWDQLQSPYAAVEMPFNFLKGYGENLNKDLGKPMEGGDVAGRIGQNLYDRPVSTALDLFPFLGLKKTLAGEKPPVAEVKPPTPEVPVYNKSLINQLNPAENVKVATSIAKVPSYVTVNEADALMKEAVQLTPKAHTGRAVAENLGKAVEATGKEIGAWAKEKSAKIGLTPLDDTSDIIMQNVKSSDPAIRSAALKEVDSLLNTGEDVVKGIRGTTIEKVNQARIELYRRIKESRMNAGKNEMTTAEQQLEQARYEAAQGINQYLKQIDTENVLGDALHRYHVEKTGETWVSDKVLHSPEQNILSKIFVQGTRDYIIDPLALKSARKSFGPYQKVMDYLKEPEAAAPSAQMRAPMPGVISETRDLSPITQVGKALPGSKLFFNPNTPAGKIEQVSSPMEKILQLPKAKTALSPKVGRAKYTSEALRVSMADATSLQDQVARLDSFVTEFSKNQASKQNWLDLRAGLEKESKIALGGGTGDYKRDYAMRVNSYGDPGVGPLLKRIDSYIQAIDSKINEMK